MTIKLDKKTKPMNEIMTDEKNALKILKDKNLLLNIMNEMKKNVVANEDMILALINKICIRLVINSHPTSSNVLISDSSGAGKDWIVTCVSNLLLPSNRYFHITDISEKLLNYWKIPEKDGGTFDERVIHLEDPAEERMKSQAFKVRASGQNELRFVEKGKSKHIRVIGKPVMVVTSMLATIDIEGVRRWDSLRVDTSRHVTKLMKELYAKKEARLIDDDMNMKLKYALSQKLDRVTVTIPYALQLCNILPDTLIIRTQIQKLFDYIKSSAALFQYQRKKNENGAIIANVFDCEYGLFCFDLLKDIQGAALSKCEEEIVTVISENPNGVRVNEIANRVSVGKSSLYGDTSRKGYLENMKEKGILKEYTTVDPDINNRMVTYWALSEEFKLNFIIPIIPKGVGITQQKEKFHHSTSFQPKNSQLVTEGDDAKVYIGEGVSFQFSDLVRTLNMQRQSIGLKSLIHSQNIGMIKKIGNLKGESIIPT